MKKLILTAPQLDANWTKFVGCRFKVVSPTDSRKFGQVLKLVDVDEIHSTSTIREYTDRNQNEPGEPTYAEYLPEGVTDLKKSVCLSDIICLELVIQFDKAEKHNLKRLKLWKRTKKRIYQYIKRTNDYRSISSTITLQSAFCWKDTPEGYNFWANINKHIKENENA